jgi:NADH-ubiquinone oxidoreductase chain 1
LGVSGEFLIRLVLQTFILVLIVFSRVCFLTLLERKILGYAQNRKGPTKILFYGLLQPVIDGGKLILKRVSLEKFSYVFIPFLSIFIIRVLRILITFSHTTVVVRNMTFIILIISTLIVYTLFCLGWRRENVYGVIGGLRRSSQIIAYEVIIFFVIILLVIFHITWDFSSFTFSNIFVLDIFVVWLLILLVETNRRPFDFAEGERELVSGYNIEYRGVLFAYIFIAEYGILVFFSWVTRVIFFSPYAFWLVLLGLILVRGFIPRRRYDILIRNCWKFIFIVLRFLIFKFF